jgi:hypothetical protein
MSAEGLAALITAITGLVTALGTLGMHLQLRAKVNANAVQKQAPKDVSANPPS